MSTYVDSAGAIRDWINAQTTALVGVGNPLQQGAHLKHLQGATPGVYTLVEELPARASDDSPEDPDMLAVLSFQIYGGTRDAATRGAVALAEALGGMLGMPVTVPTTPPVTVQVADDLQGPSWVPDGDIPRLILQATIRMRPA